MNRGLLDRAVFALGSKLPLTLIFEKSGEMQLEAEIKAHGGAALADVSQSRECTFCHGAIPPDSRSKVTLHMADGKQQ